MITWPDLELPPINLWSYPMDDQKSKSPCTGICKLDTSGTFCIGCGRTTSDLAKWTRMTPQEREEATWAAYRRLWE